MPEILRFTNLFFAAALIAPLPAASHEFWIEPRSYELNVGESIEADLKNGEVFKGSTYPFLKRFFSDFIVIDRAGARPVDGRMGDNPAVNLKTERGGLHVFAYASTRNIVNYAKFDKFEAFVKSKRLDRIADTHRERGWPMEKIKETYYRYAKALVKVGSGAGRDRSVGMPIELVAEINPYSAAAKDGVRFQLLWRGAPLPDWDVQVFHFAPGADEATTTHLTTDKTGRVTVPPMGGGEFLVNAVQITEPRVEDAQVNALWESIWASTTYALPAEAE